MGRRKPLRRHSEHLVMNFVPFLATVDVIFFRQNFHVYLPDLKGQW
jgi:hypothetical protein